MKTASISKTYGFLFGSDTSEGFSVFTSSSEYRSEVLSFTDFSEIVEGLLSLYGEDRDDICVEQKDDSCVRRFTKPDATLLAVWFEEINKLHS